MGIHNRDYMRRPGDDGHHRGTSIEDHLAQFLQRHPRFFLYVGLVVVALVVLAVVAINLETRGS